MNARWKPKLFWISAALATIAVTSTVVVLDSLDAPNLEVSDDSAVTELDSASTATLSTKSAQWATIDDPSRDGWDSEAFSEDASGQLELLGELIRGPRAPDPHRVSGLVDDSFSTQGLVPETLTTVYQDGMIRVEQADVGSAGKRDPGQFRAVRVCLRP